MKTALNLIGTFAALFVAILLGKVLPPAVMGLLIIAGGVLAAIALAYSYGQKRGRKDKDQ